MIEQLRRAVEDEPALEPFCSGRQSTTTTTTTTTTMTTPSSTATASSQFSNWLSGDAQSKKTTTASGDGASFDAVAYARDAFSRSRASDASSTSTLDDVALLAEGARRMESLIRDEVVSKRETLDRTLGGVREAEMTLDVIRLGTQEIRDAVARVASELGEPHAAIEASTTTLARVTQTGEVLRGVVRVLKLSGKLREAYAARDDADKTNERDASELSKAAKLLGEIKLALNGGDFAGIDVIDEQMSFIRECAVGCAREANEALGRGMELKSQSEVGAALQVHYNLNELGKVVDARVAAYAAAAVDAFKDALDVESLGREASGADARGVGPGGHKSNYRASSSAPPSGAEHVWIDTLWRRVDAAMQDVHENAMSVWHLQRVLAKKRDPLTQALFLEEVVGKAASSQALCDRFWAMFAKGVTENLSRTHAAAGFVSGVLLKGFPRLVGALEECVRACARDADGAKGAPGCTRKDDSTRAQVVRAAEPIAAAYFARSLSRLTEAANNCFAGGRIIDEMSTNRLLSRIRNEIDAVAEYDHLLGMACTNASTALKTLAERAKRSVLRSADAANLTEDATPSQQANAQIAEQLSRVHSLLSRVLPSFAPTPRRALEVGLEHIASSVLSATDPLFEAVGDWCDARFAQMHAASSDENTGGAAIVAVTSTLAHIAESHAALTTSGTIRGPLFSARLALGERILTSFLNHASLVREFAQGGKMRMAKNCGDIETAVKSSLRLGGAETETFKAAKAFKSLVLLPTESIDGSPLLREVPDRVLLHHLYSRAPQDLSTPAKRASLNAAQYASWLTKKASDAEIWRGVRGTLDVYAETHADAKTNSVLILMRRIGERM